MKPKLTLYFDGACPLCRLEIDELKLLNSESKLNFVDVNHEGFTENYPHVQKSEALAKLHGETDQGQMLYGLDVTVLAWTTVGKYRWLHILRWPILCYAADLAYYLFARYRTQIALLFFGRQCRRAPGCNNAARKHSDPG